MTMSGPANPELVFSLRRVTEAAACAALRPASARRLASAALVVDDVFRYASTWAREMEFPPGDAQGTDMLRSLQEDYDELVDSPVEVGPHTPLTFTAASNPGAAGRSAVRSAVSPSMARMTRPWPARSFCKRRSSPRATASSSS